MGWWQATKDLLGVVRRADKIQLVREMQDLEEENQTLKKENRELREQLKFKERTHFVETVYLDRKIGAAYCAKCLDADQKAIRLHETLDDHDAVTAYYCPVCQRSYDPPRYPF